MRIEIKKLLAREDVEYAIGYEKGTFGFQVSPSFAFTPEDVDKFIFSPLCTHNLTLYLKLEGNPIISKIKKAKKKIVIVVKGCDSKTINVLIQEKGINREDIIIVGISCKGIIDPKKIESLFPNKAGEIKEKEEKYIISIDGKEQEILKEELIFDKCKRCEYPKPVIYDILLGDKVEPKKNEYEDIKRFEEKSLKKKWEYWEKKLSECTRCYACRNVCPLCYCKECTVEQLNPRWIRRSVDISENTAWNILRAFHLAGRCIDCGECERVCPVNIPLTELNRKIEKDVREIFDFIPGINPNEKPLLVTFKPDDPEDFII